MEVNDAIIVVPTLLLVAVVTVYALMATYAGIVIYEQTCSKCGETLPTETAFDEHMEAHMEAEERLGSNSSTPPTPPSIKEGKVGKVVRGAA